MDKRLPKVLIFNAPPSSGKDLSAEYCCQFVAAEHKRFKEYLMVMTARILKIPYKNFLDMYDTKKDKADKIRLFEFLDTDTFLKDNVQSYSIREFMIHLSEYVMKPIYGNDFFGICAGKDLSHTKWNIFSDGGFKDEIDGLLTYTCKENIIVVKIQRDGCTFENDSRGWIDDSLVGQTIYMENNGTLEEWYLKLDELIESL